MKSAPARGSTSLVDTDGTFEPPPHYFVTVDAETEHIQDGIGVISALRDDLEARERLHIPLAWFVRFQRTWTESVETCSPETLQTARADLFDGFALARDQLLELQARGDEVGWHYHAYNYVHRDDLSHETRLRILQADLTSCGLELRRRHPEFAVRSFRFGWFFVPDYGIYNTLRILSITRDASLRPNHAGKRVASFDLNYPPALVAETTAMDGLSLFPFVRTLVAHDWEVIPHDLSWSRFDETEVAANTSKLADRLTGIARTIVQSGGAFLTYKTFPVSLLAAPVDG